MGGGSGRRRAEGYAGHRLFKTSTQHHMVVWKLAWRKTQPYAVVITVVVRITIGGDPCGPRKAVL
eukprot:2995777-Pyramimonas_sp.AAC.1